MNDVESEIREIVDRETRAWDTRDAELLLSVFHPDMVWPWPRTSSSHDPVEGASFGSCCSRASCGLLAAHTGHRGSV